MTVDADPLRAARGIVLAALLGAVIWVLVIAGLLAWIKQ